MPRKPPPQKPGKSETVVCTPPKFLVAASNFLGIRDFSIDFAANRETRIVPRYIGPGSRLADDALTLDWRGFVGSVEWGWCNPPYSNIAPWVKKAAEFVIEEPKISSGVAMLVPASTGANWWRDYVDGFADIRLLNGRLTFVGHTAPYPKDLALLLYSTQRQPGYTILNWREHV